MKVEESGNGFILSVSNYNTRHLTVMSTVYGIPNGKKSIGFVPEKITSDSIIFH